jgi:two-component system LytT family response regulator
MIKAVIIDDEPAMQQVNSQLLYEYFPDIKLLGVADSIEKGTQLILKENPDLVLLDIELQDGTGFQLLQKLKPYTFKVVFITGFHSFAIKAIKFSALDYVLKPVNETEFQQAIQKAIDFIADNKNNNAQTENFFSNYNNSNSPKKVVLRTSDAMHIVGLDEILYCKSDNSYTTFFLKGKKEITVSRSIKEFAELFAEYKFLRPHQSFLVNLQGIVKIDKTDGGFIIMANGAEIPISSRRKQVVFDELEKL